MFKKRMKQITLNKEFSLKGKGLHTGKEVTIKFLPAEPNYGYKLQRVDLENQPIMDASSEYVTDTSRGTVLENGECRVGTIEHALAALYANEIDNCLIQLDAPEAPILDGSSKFYVEEIQKIGTKEQEAEKKYFEVKEKIVYRDEETNTELILLPDDNFSVDTLISYDSPVLYNQFASLNDVKEFNKDFSSCRTFVFVRELEILLQHNLIKGGDLDNAIVIVDREMTQEELDKMADLFDHKRVEVKQGVLNNIDLQFSNECARHKLLDVIGDVSLCGAPIKGKIIATRPGHKANTRFANLIRKEIIKQNKFEAPYKVDVNAKALMDINQIKNLLPHRPPFLLVDKILEVSKSSIVGIKNVTLNEPFFVGHFPEEPVMPGVLIVEAMAQCGGIMVLMGVDEPEHYSTYFMKIDKVKYRQKVVPGDQLVFKLELISPIRRGIVNMRGLAFVGDNIVAEGEFMAQVIKNKG